MIKKTDANVWCYEPQPNFYDIFLSFPRATNVPILLITNDESGYGLYAC